MPPNRPAAASMAERTAAASVTSHVMDRSGLDGRRSRPAVRQPCLLNSAAGAAPMPLAAPGMATTGAAPVLIGAAPARRSLALRVGDDGLELGRDCLAAPAEDERGDHRPDNTEHHDR